MIFAECECGKDILVAWDSGMTTGYYRTNCECGKIAMTELTSLGGETHILDGEKELEEFIEEKQLNKPSSDI